nr:SCP2 sterol-binding domain-containing protein [Halomonas dongshanensis]
MTSLFSITPSTTIHHLIYFLEPRVPFTAKKRIVEPLLNHAFSIPLAEGEFDTLENRRISLVVADLGITLSLTLKSQRLILTQKESEATIRGGWREFLCLAMREEDPDTLFFQRRLIIEGDTELGLTLKNLLDGCEEILAQKRLREIGVWLERLSAKRRTQLKN